MNISQIKRAYFIGIGGIGMSAIARFMAKEGIQVFGYDKTRTTLTKKLESEGMKIHYDIQSTGFPEGLDLVIYTPAIPLDHTELQHFKASSIPVMKRSEVLGMVANQKKSIAIAGTHGKTSTSAILSHILTFGKLDISAFVGGIMVNYDSNFIHGYSDWMVLEADEYDRSFLQLSPEIAAVISIDPDHLDIYGDHDLMLKTGFSAFVKRLKPGGTIYVSHQSWNSLKEYCEVLLDDNNITVNVCGIEVGEIQARNIRVEKGWMVFDWVNPEENIENLKLVMPGLHNVLNASIAIAIASHLGMDANSIRNAMAAFRGIRRRFEKVYEGTRYAYIDDYAHHPSELNAAIETARMIYPGKEVLGVFQPHLYSRTRDFLTGFIASLNRLDKVILLPIYPAREEALEGIDSGLIYEGLDNIEKYLVSKNRLIEILEKVDFDVILTLGAGDIDTCVNEIKEYLIRAEAF